MQALIDEHKKLVKEATPLYVAMLSSNPFYKAREHDEHFWSNYIGSRIVAARELVARSKAASTAKTQEPELSQV